MRGYQLTQTVFRGSTFAPALVGEDESIAMIEIVSPCLPHLITIHHTVGLKQGSTNIDGRM